MATRIISGIEELKTLVGQEVGASDLFEITQTHINDFADATEDHQWIHVNPERAKTESPFGATIAHGFLTLSLLPHLAAQAVKVQGNFKMGINYGLNKVRFLAPVVVGSRIRVRSDLLEVTKVSDDIVNLTIRNTVELDGSDKPAAVADMITRVIY